MAYSITWDEGVPVGATTPAADIDTELQKIKTALRERLEQVMPDFDDDLLDPKLIIIQSDVAANKPASPDYQGQLYFAEDTGQLYIGDASLTWVGVGIVAEEGDGETASQTLYTSAQLSGNFSIPAGGAWTSLSGWTVNAQRGVFYAAGTPTRFTAPALGSYKISVNLTCGNLGDLFVRVLQNNTYTIAQAYVGLDDTENTLNLDVVTDIPLNDYIEIQCSNASPTFPAEVKGTYSHMTIHRIY